MGSKTESCPNCGTGVTVPDVRIYTRCPACHNDTLTVHDNRLLCTWHKCPDPTRIDRDVIEKLTPEESLALDDFLSNVECSDRLLIQELQKFANNRSSLLVSAQATTSKQLSALRHAIAILKQVGAL